MQSSTSKDLYNYGAFAGVLAIILQLGYYLFIDQFSSFGKVSGVDILIVVNFIIYFFRDRVKKKEGFATFKEVFSVFMINRIINITLSLGFVVLLYFVIDTDFRDLVAERIMKCNTNDFLIVTSAKSRLKINFQY